ALQQFFDPLYSVATAVAAQRQQLPQRRVCQWHQQVVGHTQFREWLHDLKCTCQTALRTAVGGQSRDVVASEGHAPFIGDNGAGNQVEEGGLASPVGSKQPDHFALFEVQVDVG